MTTHQTTRILIALMAVVILAMATLVAYSPPAPAHTITQADCRHQASAHITTHGEPTLTHWRIDFRACKTVAERHAIWHRCHHPTLPIIPRGARVKGRLASFKQRRNITIALNLARRMHAPRNHWIALIAATTQESSSNNLPYGTGSSVGILQLISDHGTVAWRMHVSNSVGWFLRGARSIDPGGQRAPGTLAQAVQASAHPTLYRQWTPEAQRTIKRYLGPCVR